jgi:polyphosphate glucokinase
LNALGIDIGGTGIKCAPVDTVRGVLLSERLRVRTPQPATPEAVAAAVRSVVAHFDWSGPVGLGLPGVVRQRVVRFAPHLDPVWLGVDAVAWLEQALGRPAAVLNDADAAGLAELRFGAGRDRAGVVVVVTLGTGIGTALFVDGRLVPNTEFGHIEVRGKDAERRASEGARLRKGWTWKQWARRVDEYLKRLEAMLWPDLIILGGGGSKHHARFMPYLTVGTPVVPAGLLNDAGIVGTALVAAEQAAGNSDRRLTPAAA